MINPARMAGASLHVTTHPLGGYPRLVHIVAFPTARKDKPPQASTFLAFACVLFVIVPLGKASQSQATVRVGGDYLRWWVMTQAWEPSRRQANPSPSIAGQLQLRDEARVCLLLNSAVDSQTSCNLVHMTRLWQLYLPWDHLSGQTACLLSCCFFCS